MQNARSFIKAKRTDIIIRPSHVSSLATLITTLINTSNPIWYPMQVNRTQTYNTYPRSGIPPTTTIEGRGVVLGAVYFCDGVSWVGENGKERKLTPHPAQLQLPLVQVQLLGPVQPQLVDPQSQAMASFLLI